MMLGLLNKKVIAIIIVFLLIVVAYNTTFETNKDGVLVLETPATPRYLDPATNYETTGGNIISNVYETLISYNGSSTSEIIPVLVEAIPTVENGLLSPDGINYTFDLKRNVKFHNGDIMDADDVIYSFTRVIRMHQGPSWMVTQVLNESGLIKNDDHSVTFRLYKPYSAFIFVLTHTVCSIVSKDVVEAHGGIEDNSMNEWMNTHMVGTGPFKLKEWAEDRSFISIERFDGYHGTKALLDEVIIKSVSELTTRIINLELGYADAVYVPPTMLDEVRGKDGIVVNEGAMRLAGYFICMNCQRPPFNDVRVRQAATLAFDYEFLMDYIYQGLGQRYVGPWVHGIYGYNDDLDPYEQDVEEAKDLLKEYKAEKGISGDLEVTLYYTMSEISDLVAQLFKSNMDDIGIEVTLQFLSWPSLLEKVKGKDVGTKDEVIGEFEAALLGWLSDYPHPDGMSPIVKWDLRGPGGNNAWYRNDYVSQILNESEVTTNESRKLEIYHEVHEIVAEECPYVWTIQPNTPFVFRKWVKNYVESYNPFMGRYYATVYKDK